MLLERALDFVEQHMDEITRKARTGDALSRTVLYSYKSVLQNRRDTRSRLALRQSIRSYRNIERKEDMGY